MIGAIIGDIAGSRFEWHNHRSKDFELVTKDCRFTDDSVMSLAVAKAILEAKGQMDILPAEAVKWMQELGRRYPRCGFGGGFKRWVHSNDPKPYNSFGNGSAMRVSGCGYAASSLEDAKALSLAVTGVTHNHPEGLKGAESVAAAIYLARTGKTLKEIREYVIENYYQIDFTLDSIRDSYEFSSSCQGSVPQSFEAFFESDGFEDAVRNAISIGGDSDTLAAITGSIAEAYYGVPEDIKKLVYTYLDEYLSEILLEFEKEYPNQK